MERQQEFVLRTLEERDIRFVRLWFTDVLGTLKSVSVAPAELESAFDEGVGFDGSAVEGFARVYESDMVAMPDATTFQVFPFEGTGIGESARIFCDIVTPDGAPSWADPRHVLRRALARAADAGFTYYTHPEIEFFLFEDPVKGKPPVPVDEGGYFDNTTHAVARDFRRQAILALERIGISVEFSHHEVAPGQQEIDLRYADAMATADNIMTFRHVVKEVALSAGVQASFMPKPFTDQPGSGMHTHLSLFEGEDNAFHDPSDDIKLSKTGKAFIAGLLKHAPEYTAITNQWVNSYKRLFSMPLANRVNEAPAYVCWGHRNRSALVRVPAYGKPNSARVEVRSLDSATNPYLAFAVMLGAGLRGIEQGYELPPGTEDDVWALTDRERRAAGYRQLPANLAEAIDAMADSELVAEVLGEQVFDFFLKNKQAEWDDYRCQVSAYELNRYQDL
ncbi:glutamine synthetase family protein [Stackebrandtia nassauensis]|uniref:Glutamine synthetase catalytic region n=1 Tax=Stackebrandtia nassauensis (strain DSM 44728 / CIP 108903 / NRRL B-16338 / NBRC 102104 / LLR-40K-21) TaxID=446470 RepID=D3Q8M1_STANL|nr:glutamine synthetase family protein [Stackebrandtia nassauensis]ADD44463.1 glutamine synthetase catalytic region [Stackebrandtia nassauensis DSM 44728]